MPELERRPTYQAWPQNLLKMGTSVRLRSKPERLSITVFWGGVGLVGLSWRGEGEDEGWWIKLERVVIFCLGGGGGLLKRRIDNYCFSGKL